MNRLFHGLRSSGLLLLAGPLLLAVWFFWPLISGDATLFLRDVFNAHLPIKISQAEAMLEGRIPLVDMNRAGGQALLGNPNAVALYPDNVLFLFTPLLWAYNAHFWLHLLMAPFSMFWLARSLGVSKGGSAAAGVTYTFSGFFFSQLNFYNLVAGVAFTPAFVAASLAATGAARRQVLPRRWSIVALGLLWALLILGGDPMVAALALGLAALAVLIHWRGAENRLRPAVALAYGSALTLPLLVEFVRILSLTYRGHQGFQPASILTASWDPRTAIEWLVPLAFRGPGPDFWGQALFIGGQPLFFSLYPGLLAIVLLVCSIGRDGSGRSTWSWLLVGGGFFFALGAFNPLVWWLSQHSFAQFLRFPIKFFLAIAVGAAVLCGLGFERLIESDAASRRRTLRRVLLALSLTVGVAWIVCEAAPGLVHGVIEGWIRGVPPEGHVEGVRLEWLATLRVTVLAAVVGLVALWRLPAGPAWRRVAGHGLLAAHVGFQLAVLAPIVPMDDVRLYAEEPPLARSVEPGERVVHGNHGSMFSAIGVARHFGTGEWWLPRFSREHLHPFAGVAAGLRYEFNLSPEGLDSFLTRTTYQAMRHAPSDLERIRLLRASGVDVILLDREIEAEAAAEVRLRDRSFGFGSAIHVYEIVDAMPEATLAGSSYGARSVSEAVAAMLSPSFDPDVTAILAGGGESHVGPAGTATVVAENPDEILVDVQSAQGGILILKRAHLPIYQADVAGELVQPIVVNSSRLGVRVPAGSHRVRVWADRGSLRIGLLGLPLGVLGLVLLYRRERDAVAED